MKTWKRFLFLMSLCGISPLPLGAESFHTVERGETIYSISHRYKVTVEDLMKGNGIASPSTLGEGVVLTIPSEESSPVNEDPPSKNSHLVQEGDTLYEIALRYGLSVRKLLSLNNLKKTVPLRIGQKLSLGATPTTSSEEARTSTAEEESSSAIVRPLPSTDPSASTPNSHLVQKGDTLYKIALQYGLSVRNLLSFNNLVEAKPLRIGQKLSLGSTPVPSPSAGERVSRTPSEQRATVSSTTSLSPPPTDSPLNTPNSHLVQRGDTLYKIGLQYGIPVHKLLSLNKIEKTKPLIVGQKISLQTTTLPSPPSVVSSEGSDHWPVSGLVAPFEGKLRGVKIRTNSRGPVRAVRRGKVVWSGPYRGFSEVVLIESDGLVYLYGGGEEVLVKVGQRVKAGDVIAQVLSNEEEFGDVYFSVFSNGVPLNPEKAPRG